MAERIPEDIIADILLRLPMDSLFRCKCTSKSWRDLIDSSYFKEMHRGFVKPDTQNIITILVGNKIYAIFDYVVDNGEKEDYRAISRMMAQVDMTEYSYRLYMTGSCNGIVCISSIYTAHFALCNPFSQLTSPPHEFTCDYSYRIKAALGYDHINHDFKVVKWYEHRALSTDRYKLCVYSLNENSWRIITDAGKLNLDPHGLPDEYGFCFANGATHWILGSLGTYEFRQISCAPLPQGAICTRASLSNLNGCICLGYTYIYPRDEGPLQVIKVDLWVLREYGVEDSWTKLTCINDLFPGDYFGRLVSCKGVAYSEKRGKLMLQLGEENIVMYDFDTKSLKHVTVC